MMGNGSQWKMSQTPVIIIYRTTDLVKQASHKLMHIHDHQMTQEIEKKRHFLKTFSWVIICQYLQHVLYLSDGFMNTPRADSRSFNFLFPNELNGILVWSSHRVTDWTRHKIQLKAIKHATHTSVRKSKTFCIVCYGSTYACTHLSVG